MYTKKFGLQFFGEELSTKKEFHNCVDHCAVAVQKDSDDYLPSRSGSDSTCFLVKYLSIDIPRGTCKISQDKITYEMKIIMNFNVANSVIYEYAYT